MVGVTSPLFRGGDVRGGRNLAIWYVVGTAFAATAGRDGRRRAGPAAGTDPGVQRAAGPSAPACRSRGVGGSAGTGGRVRAEPGAVMARQPAVLSATPVVVVTEFECDSLRACLGVWWRFVRGTRAITRVASGMTFSTTTVSWRYRRVVSVSGWEA